MAKHIKILFFVKSALFLLVVALLYVVINKGINMWKQNGGVNVQIGADKSIELTPQEIKQIENIGEWEFLSVQTEVVTDTLREGVFSDDRLVAIYKGKPRIGINMKNVKDGWLQTRSDTAILNLPKVKLLDRNFIDEARTNVFYESGKWSNNAHQLQYYKAYHKMIKKCITKENIEKAEENGRLQFESLFKTLGFNVVEVNFEQ